jgi:hypothetical protein
MDEPLTITFTVSEYERLVSDGTEKQGRLQAESEIAETIAAIAAFLRQPPTREREGPALAGAG